jgi:outer membrane protein OmpA-like peptidoglycan-associated protein
MDGQAVLAVMIVVGAMGCKSALEPPQPPPADQHLEVASMPSSASSLPITNTTVAPPSEVRDEGAVLTRERRCRAHERREPPAGALAWVSDCYIKMVKPIRFQLNSDTIHADSVPTLDAVAAILHSDHTLRIEIGAHSDGRGSQQYNKELTQKRADAVRNHLMGNGIDAERLVAQGFGDERPISHPPNRRIEFVIFPE